MANRSTLKWVILVLFTGLVGATLWLCSVAVYESRINARVWSAFSETGSTHSRLSNLLVHQIYGFVPKLGLTTKNGFLFADRFQFQISRARSVSAEELEILSRSKAEIRISFESQPSKEVIAALKSFPNIKKLTFPENAEGKGKVSEIREIAR